MVRRRIARKQRRYSNLTGETLPGYKEDPLTLVGLDAYKRFQNLAEEVERGW